MHNKFELKLQKRRPLEILGLRERITIELNREIGYMKSTD
jgi:hypothetical protein